jgi:hypothetical protein
LRKYVIGIGLVFFVIHNPNQPFINYAFLPWIGIALLVAAIASVPFKKFKKIGLGSRWVWVSLLVLCFAIAASGMAQYLRGEVTLSRGLAPLASTLIWFGLYMVARLDGEGIGKPVAIAVIIEAASTTISAFATGGVRNGGIVSPTNYDIATAVLVFGTFIAPRKWQWWLSSIAIVGLFFTGAEEGMVAIGATSLVILMVRDWHWKTLVPISALIMCLMVATPLGITQRLYIGVNSIQAVVTSQSATTTEVAALHISDVVINPSTTNKFKAVEMAWNEWKWWHWSSPKFNELMNIATGYRWMTHWRIRPIKLFGYGYNLTEFYPGIPHNIILIIIEQVGLIGLAGWLVATAYCVKVSKRWYLWVTFLALGVFDHYFWTQWAPAYWIAIGISEAHRQKTAVIFKGVEGG